MNGERYLVTVGSGDVCDVQVDASSVKEALEKVRRYAEGEDDAIVGWTPVDGGEWEVGDGDWCGVRIWDKEARKFVETDAANRSFGDYLSEGGCV